MKNLSQIITILLSVLFFGYIFYTYTPIETKPESIEKTEQGFGLYGYLMDPPAEAYDIKEEFAPLEISNQGEIDLITNMIAEYNKMNIDGFTAFFADSCEFLDLNSNLHTLKQEDFQNAFSKMDSVKWTPTAIVPLKLVNDESFFGGKSRTGTVVHSVERRYKKDGSVWEKELIEVFYIKNNKIIVVNQFGKSFDPDNYHF